MHTIRQTGAGRYEITLTRGDTLILDITMTADGEPFVPEAGTLVFAMKEDYDAAAAVEKSIPLDTMQLEIEPEDTKTLPIGERYAFDIAYTDQTGHVDTFIEGTFVIGHEVS